MIVKMDVEVKKLVLKYKQGNESFNDTFSRLVEKSNMNTHEYSVGRSSVQLSEENVELLKSWKIYSTETYSAIILRMIDSIEEDLES